MKRKIRRFICTAMIFIMAVTSFDCTGMPGKVQAADNENDYPAVLALALDFFDENACGGDVGTLGVSWRGNCHTYDNEAALDKADNFPEQYRSLVDPDGDGKVDVSGGYHDAGDHVKFNLTMGFAGSSLALSEYLNPGVYEKAGAKAHLLKIVKRNADYLMKTTFLDGNGDVAAVCHVVGNGNTDHNIWSSPESQTYERTTYWLNAERNNTAVCCEMAAAIASAGWLYKDTDAEYTAKCVKYAKALLKFGKEHQGNDLGGLSTFYNTDGYYGSETMYGLDETAMAEAWLWVLGEGEKPGYTPDSGCYIYQGVYYGDYDFYSWNKVWQGFAALMYKATGEQSYAQALKDAYTNKQGLSASYYNDFGIEWGVSRYNCAMQMTALALANKDAASDYAKAAKYQMDYILGANTYNYSFVIGYGTNPKYIHHRAANPDQAEAKYVLKGALLGGPDKNGYKDDVHSYQYTESALDYSGCLALACAGLAELYGGSGSSSSGDETPEKKELTTVAIRCDATEKNDDGTYLATYTYTGEPVIPKEIWVYERYSSSTSYKFMEASDYYKVITDNIEPGNGKITVYPTEYGRYTFEPVTLEFPIGKAKMYADKVKETEAVYGTQNSVSIDSLVEKGGTPGEMKVTDNNGILDGAPMMEGSIVSFKIKDDEELVNKSASIRISVSESDHYKPYDILIQIKVTKAPTVWADSVSISHTELSLSINESFKLEAHILPENATHPEIKWSSGNSLIASVNEEGLVTALAEGTAKIYAASLYESSKWAECLVTVYDPSKGEPPTPAPEEPTPEEPAPTPSDPLPGGNGAKDPQPVLTDEKEQSITLVKGQKFLLSDKDWKSSNKKVVSVSGKTVAAKKSGNAALTFGKGEEEYKIDITVIAPQIAKNEKKQKLTVGQSAQLKLSGIAAADGSITFSGNEPMDILFYSSAPDVALVDDSGNIKAVSKGSATITAYINSVAFKWTVKVSEDTAPKERTLHINVGKSKAVKIKGIKNTVWELSGDSIVEIKKAKITAREVGETTLTCEDHILHVFVEDPSISGSSKPYKQQLTLDTGAEHPIELARIYQDVQFKSSKPVVAFVDEDGVIHARSKGKTNITAKVNGKAVTIKLTVK